MVRGYKHRHSRASFILHFSQPVRTMIRRFSFVILIFISIVAIFAGRSENNVIVSVGAGIVDIMAPIMAVAVMPLDILRESGGAIKTYLFVHGKNLQLEEDNKKLRIQIARLYQVQKENEKMRELLKYIKEIEYKYVTAKVVGNASGPFARSALINAGEDDAVLKGQAVVMDGGLVGRIIEVGHHSSRVLLLTDINSRVPVISMDSRERSILSGNNTENPKLTYLPKQSKIADGEVMVTSGDGDVFPPGIMVGRAYKLSDSSYEVVPFVSWHNIEYVSVLGLKEDN